MSDKMIFKCDIYDLLIEKLLNRLNNFIRYNPDDLNRRILKKVIEEVLSEVSHLSIDDIDSNFESYAKIRIYSESKNGIHIKTNFDYIFIPNLSINSVNQSEIEKIYVLNFFSKINEVISTSNELIHLIENNESEKLRDILIESNKHALNTILKKFTQEADPSE